MDKKTFENLQKKMASFNLSSYQATICKNIKQRRRELYADNKSYYKENNLKNPYTAESVAELLNISFEYYKRIESFDKTKPISLKLLLKASVLFDIDIEDLFK